jgi:hypothetical protein
MEVRNELNPVCFIRHVIFEFTVGLERSADQFADKTAPAAQQTSCPRWNGVPYLLILRFAVQMPPPEKTFGKLIPGHNASFEKGLRPTGAAKHYSAVTSMDLINI